MLKKGIFIIFCCALLFLGIYYESLVNLGIQFFIEKQSKELEIPLSYSEIQSSPHVIVFKDPILNLKGGTVQAKQLVLKHHLKPFSRHINVTVELDSPIFSVEKEKIDLENLFNSFAKKASLITTSGKICCSNGCLSLFSKKQEKIFFDFEHTWEGKHKQKSSHIGSYFLNLNEKEEESTLQIIFNANDPSQVEVQANLKKVSAERLTETLKTFIPELSNWDVKQGILDGEFAFALGNAKFLNGKGELSIYDLEVEEKSLGVFASINRALFCTNAETGNASLEIFDNGFLYFTDGQIYASFKDFNGKVEITDADLLYLKLNGVWEDREKPLQTNLEGSFHLNEFADIFLQISLNSVDFKEQPSFIKIDAKNLGGSNGIAKIDLQRFGPKQFHFWQRFIEKLMPRKNPITYIGGTLNGLFHVNINKENIESLEIKNFAASQVAFTLKDWDAAFGAEQVLGKFSINLLQPRPQDTLNADLQISNGETSLIGFSSEFWHFNHIETRLFIRDGIIQKSFASVELAGLKGSAEVRSSLEKEMLKFELQGSVLDLKPFLPEKMQKGMDHNFANELLTVNASVAKTEHGIKISGNVKLQNPDMASLLIPFGFELERSPEEFLANPQFYDHSKAIIQATQELTLPAFYPFLHQQEHVLLNDSGIHGFKIKNGWLSANNVPLGKYVSPFLFSNSSYTLKGMSNFKGQFDHLGLKIYYDARSLSLENDIFAIDLEKILPHQAYHYFDFTTGKHFGELPLKHGSYFDKNSGLLFSDVHAHVVFEEKKIHFLDVSTFSNGLYFDGTIDIDHCKQEKGHFDMEIAIHTLHGKFSQVQHFFSHFNKPFAFLSIPLEGDIALRNEGCRLQFAFKPNDFRLNTEIEGHICDAVLQGENTDLSINALSLNFTYDSKNKLLNFSDLQGTLLTNIPSSIEEYTLHSNRIHFSNFENNEAEFDIWVKDQNRDLIRLAGTTSTRLNDNEEKEIVFSFDPSLTHFGEIRPQQIALSLSNWTKIAKAKLDFNFRLSTFLYDIQRFGKSGLLFSSPKFLKELSNLKNAGGECEACLNYDSSTSAFTFAVQGVDVTFDNYTFKTVNLNGKMQDKIWTIDQLLLDQLAIAAEFTKIDSLWKANFLGIRYGKSLLAGLEGEYQEGDQSIKARINLFEANLARLKEWPELEAFVKEYSPEGMLRGAGEFTLEFKKHSSLRYEIALDASLSHAKLKNLNFKDFKNFGFHYSSDKGLWIKNAKTEMLLTDTEKPLQLNLDIYFDHHKNELHFLNTHFALPSHHIENFIKEVSHSFPTLFSDNLAAIIRNSKKDGILEGKLDVKKVPTHTDIRLSLEDGAYFFANKEHHLSSFTLQANHKNITFSTKYQFNKHHFNLSGLIDAGTLDKGEFTLKDAMHYESPELAPFVIQWKKDAQNGFIIENAHGFFSGMRIQLTESSNNPSTSSSLHLEGEIVALNDQFRYLLDDETSETIVKWQTGKGCILQGVFTIAKEHMENSRPLCFYGMLLGDNFHFKGYQLKHLHSQVIFGPQTIQLSDISITDPAGALYIDKILIKKEGEKSQLSIPLLRIQELRPSLLVEVDKPYPAQKKPLVIKNLEIRDFKGVLGDELSFVGKGSLYFNNPVKKHLQNTIFAFPAEILTRIGLDLSVLTPVTGTIQYEIRDGKVFLTKFKDIYSDSKLSRFYLPHSRTPSYMDFDGNLNIQVKMKQHTLIFKLAELFTVTIHGNLTKPSYTLLRQKPLQRSEVIASTNAE